MGLKLIMLLKNNGFSNLVKGLKPKCTVPMWSQFSKKIIIAL